MKTKTILAINGVKTLNDYLNVLQSEFNTVECKPGKFVKATVIYTLMSKLNGQNVIVTESVKNKALQSENVSEFIKIVQGNFNTNQLFSHSALGGLVADTNKLILLTGLKEKEQEEPPAETDEKKKKTTSRNRK